MTTSTSIRPSSTATEGSDSAAATVQWIEFDGDRRALIDRLQPGEGVFAVEFKVDFMSEAVTDQEITDKKTEKV